MKAIAITILLFVSVLSFGQGMSFTEAKAKGIFPKVDEVYKSAVHSEPDKAVFKTEAEADAHIKAYQEFLIGLGAFLKHNNFTWDEATRGFNRIYMKPDGTIDYFLYDFKTPLSEPKLKEFERLLNLYIKNHKFGRTAGEKFAQCSPVTYPKSE